MRFDILSNRPAAERAMREDLLRRKYAAKEETARAATMRGQAAKVTAGTGRMAVEREYERWPTSLPTRRAETARISATGYAESARRGAATTEKEFGLEREKFEFAKRYLAETGELPDGERERGDISTIKDIAGGVARIDDIKCPKGFGWDGKKCVPLM
jgi:hypothetical protein